jgi:uncharacterized protein (DUF1684 family)
MKLLPICAFLLLTAPLSAQTSYESWSANRLQEQQNAILRASAAQNAYGWQLAQQANLARSIEAQQAFIAAQRNVGQNVAHVPSPVERPAVVVVSADEAWIRRRDAEIATQEGRMAVKDAEILGLKREHNQQLLASNDQGLYTEKLWKRIEELLAENRRLKAGINAAIEKKSTYGLKALVNE